jgi:type II secretory pathway component GspD/PulD (secretin)
MFMKSFTVVALTILTLTGCSTRERPAVTTPGSVAATSESAAGSQSSKPASPASEGDAKAKTFSSFDRPVNARREIAAGSIQYNEADVRLVFDLYQELSARSLIYSARVPKNVKVTFRNNSALSRTEALQALDTVLAAQGIVMVYSGSQYVKVCAAAEAGPEAPPSLDIPWRELPDSGSFLSYTVRLKNIDASTAISSLQPFARLPNSIIGNRANNMLILRDLSSNVRRMLEVLERIEETGPGAPDNPNK